MFFLELRKRTGGYHLDKFYKCYLATVVSYLVIVIISARLSEHPQWLFAILVIAITGIGLIGNNTSANAIRRGTGTTDSSGKFEIDISLPPGIGVYSYYGSTSTHYFDICGVSVSPSDDSSISASETIFHLAYTMYHPF